MKNLFILILLLSSFLTACNDEEELPSISAHGANTFGCKVNGQVWVANSEGGWSSYEALSGGAVAVDTSKNGYSREYKYHFELSAHRKDGTWFKICLAELPKEGTYLLDMDVKPPTMGTEYYKNYAIYGRLGYFITSSTTTGYITFIKADRKLGKYAGTFGFRCKNETTSEVLEITEGRFDRDQ